MTAHSLSLQNRALSQGGFSCRSKTSIFRFRSVSRGILTPQSKVHSFQPILCQACPAQRIQAPRALQFSASSCTSRSQTSPPRRSVVAAAAPTSRRRTGGRSQKKQEEQAPQRLSKVLAAAGIASRRAAEELIFAGEVKLNGKVVKLPQTPADPTKDQIEVRGKPVQATPQKKYYFAVNKPKGFACTAATGEGEGGTRLVTDLFETWLKRWKREHPRGLAPPRLFTVGRLDVQTTGLLLVTNDGQWAQKVSHPSAGLTKEYIATSEMPATKQQLQKIADGATVDGVHVTPVAVAIDMSDPAFANRRIRIIVSEGRNREVRTLMENAGLSVKYLKRVRIGGFRLPKELGLGAVQALKPNEVRRTLDRGASL